ncbi:F-box protein [Tripterygium wilfordii]|uniref:F-box protein n=1 Tax=Tripterygium wilfordii TaxID=458696 RepID=A0A7J7C559_TRIWF|nr:probable F-box protein At4g22030 [Tripterygium wilfordii]KAF5729075.1 F-box protein [Tripterygium wilfordii]
MATLQASCMLLSSSSATTSTSLKRHNSGIVNATMNANLYHPKLQNISFALEELNMGEDYSIATKELPKPFISGGGCDNQMLITEKLHVIKEAVADRVEMHRNIGEQRDDWNQLLLNSINAITLTAATMTGLAGAVIAGGSSEALKVSSTVLYAAATGMLIIMNKIQPSQLAEEQRNAGRLFKKLHSRIQTMLSIGNPTMTDVDDAIEKVLALDRAYPLPLLGAMLEKFPSNVEPAVWWPPQQRQKQRPFSKFGNNGWSRKIENEMREVVGVLKRNDKEDYLRLAEKALKLNRVLAISGPLLTGLATFGSAFVGHGSWAVIVGVVGGAMASVVNAIEHGGQVGMLFEMYRGNAGFFKLMEETIESNLIEKDVERRENGDLLELQVALQLGRSLSELRDLATSSSTETSQEFATSSCTDTTQEFASKLF